VLAYDLETFLIAECFPGNSHFLGGNDWCSFKSHNCGILIFV
jgi:hypothetical protein